MQAFLEQRLEGVTAELLIINDHPDTPLLSADERNRLLARNVQELKVKGGPYSLGELRNLAMQMTDSDYMMQWDDDDFSHPDRITWQASNTRFEKKEATIFRWEIHCNLRTRQAFANCGRQSRVRGFAGTMLWPRDGKTFPAIGKHEDTEFLLQYRKEGRLRVLQNNPQLYVRFYHGFNTWSQKHVMKQKPGSRSLTAHEQEVVDRVVQRYYEGEDAFDDPAQ